MSIFNESENELIDAARYVLRDGVERLKKREALFPTNRAHGREARKECAEAREALTLHLIAEYGSLRHETGIVALIDAQGRLITVETFPQGDQVSCGIDPRILAEKIIRTGAVAVLLAHNHPSGSSNPSKADVNLTNFLSEWLKPLGCELLDHLVLIPGDAACILGEWQ